MGCSGNTSGASSVLLGLQRRSWTNNLRAILTNADGTTFAKRRINRYPLFCFSRITIRKKKKKENVLQKNNGNVHGPEDRP